MLALPVLRQALAECAAPVVAVSPLIGGQAVKGPTAKIMSELGMPQTQASIGARGRWRRGVSRDGIWAVVPAKDLAQAKQRLAGVLTPEERQGLAQAMLEDVLSALSGVPALAGLIVVTREAAFAATAR